MVWLTDGVPLFFPSLVRWRFLGFEGFFLLPFSPMIRNVERTEHGYIPWLAGTYQPIPTAIEGNYGVSVRSIHAPLGDESTLLFSICTEYYMCTEYVYAYVSRWWSGSSRKKSIIRVALLVASLCYCIVCTDDVRPRSRPPYYSFVVREFTYSVVCTWSILWWLLIVISGRGSKELQRSGCLWMWTIIIAVVSSVIDLPDVCVCVSVTSQVSGNPV